MVPTDDGGHIPATYRQCGEVFRQGQAETLAPHRSTDNAFDSVPGYYFPYGPICNLLVIELSTLKAYIEANLANGFIKRSSSLVATSILFAKKRDELLRLSVDYSALNLATVKNHYPLHLKSGILDRVLESRILTKLDLRGANILIWINAGEECKTAFLTHYGQFKYRVMPLILTKSPVRLQSYIDDFLRPYIGDCAVCYLDDILIYSTNEKEHEEHVHQLLQQPREFALNCKAKKCQSRMSEVRFVGLLSLPIVSAWNRTGSQYLTTGQTEGR
jgi:hypothetical protein